MRVAVIGGGVAGLGATWALNEHSEHEVHLFEASSHHIGGHSNTVSFKPPSDSKILAETPVDTGFIVFNEVTYPNFLRFLNHVEVPILASDMSFAVSRTKTLEDPHIQLPLLHSRFPSLPCDKTSSSQAPDPKIKSDKERGAFEWAGSTPLALFCQWSNLVDPSHWLMIWDIIRFNHQSLESLREWNAKVLVAFGTESKDVSIGQWLDQRSYGLNFRRNYLIPMTASIWSTPPKTAFDAFPARTLLQFMHNHHLLQVLSHPQWLTIQGGSKTYVDRVVQRLSPAQLHQGQERGSVAKAYPSEEGKGWIIECQSGEKEIFDHVIFACHADTVVELLSLRETDAKRDEAGRQVVHCLRQFQFSKNKAALHSDEVLMPLRRRAWSAWNFMAESLPEDVNGDVEGVTLTYWMNLLQSLPDNVFGPVFVTLNPPEGALDPSKVVATFDYEHPLYTATSVRAQATLESLQGTWRGARFVGAWTRYGFHEDGFSSGIRAAMALGAELPFTILPAERSIPPPSQLQTFAFDSAEKLRIAIASPTCLILAPIMIVWTLIIETAIITSEIFSLGVCSSISARNELRKIRLSWEKLLTT